MKKILLIRTDKIGDVILTTPSIKIVREHFPKSHIAFMTGPHTKEIIEENPHIDELLIYDKKEIHKSPLKTLLFALALKKKKFDTAIIFNPSNRTHWITYFAHIPMRIGYSRKLKYLLTHTLEDKKHEGLKSEAFYNEELLTFLGIAPPHSKELHFQIKKESEIKIDCWLKTHTLLSNFVANFVANFVVINISTSDSSKTWPLENFISLIQLLYKKLNLKTVLIGNATSCQKVHEILSNDISFNLSETLNLSQLGALFKKSLLHISSDTGTVHIASAVGTPVVTIFGRTLPGLSPKRWAPLHGENKVLYKNIGCNPCLAHLCPLDFDCFKATKVEEVFNAVRQYI